MHNILKSPQTPQTPAWKKLYEVTEDRIEGNNESRDSVYYKAQVRLEEVDYAVSVSKRRKYKDVNELKQALGEKYLTGGAYRQYSRLQRQAMYQNELNMTMFGCLSGNMNDPHLGEPVMGSDDKERADYNRKMVNQQIGNILSGAGIDKSLPESISFYIEPYHHTLTILGIEDENTASAAERVLNEGNSWREQAGMQRRIPGT